MPMIASLWLLAWQQLIQWQMMEELESASFTTVVLNKSAIHWIRAGKEMEINGSLFDVENMSTIGDSCIVKGLFDEKEEALLKTIKKSQQESPYNTPIHLLVSKSLSLFLFTEYKTACSQLQENCEQEKYHLFTISCFTSHFLPPAGPPPKYS
ncbi:hypothetical protein QWZ08_04860 [Ferruginibacter paludis]|uniref:hypothetical protein n=1 Tax=Ferruginibacter paludis TaxID=1310417 RepID=UPI0025B47638|nr:hypothetical protein [Ferruginibacter paludis]MDN3654947.1 hypothetical protein [Ferruginibacter paludis]